MSVSDVGAAPWHRLLVYVLDMSSDQMFLGVFFRRFECMIIPLILKSKNINNDGENATRIKQLKWHDHLNTRKIQ